MLWLTVRNINSQRGNMIQNEIRHRHSIHGYTNNNFEKWVS